MKADGKKNILGVLIDPIDYESAVKKIIDAAKQHRSFAATATAVHSLMCGVKDPEHQYRLNHLDIVAPDGQPVRWALNFLYGCKLSDRVYGPALTKKVCAAAAAAAIPVFFFGSSADVLERLSNNLSKEFPELKIVGTKPSRFRQATEKEIAEDVELIRNSGAQIVFVGLGCPRQEIWAYEMKENLDMPLLAVGAAFDFWAGTLSMAPTWMQRNGLEWLYRLIQEPGRLWKRYLFLNFEFLLFMLLQICRVYTRNRNSEKKPSNLFRFG